MVLLLVTVGVLSAALALVQHFVRFEYWDCLKQILPVQRMREPAPVGGYMGGGLHFHRLKFAHTLVLLSFGVYGSMATETLRPRLLWAYLACVPIFLGGLLATFTAASWGALAIGLSLLVATRHRPCRQRTLTVALCLVGSFVIPVVLSYASSWPADRAFAWRTALALWRDHPWFGVGCGGYPASVMLAQGAPHPNHPFLHNDAHSLILQVLAERGLFGIGMLLGLLYYFQRLLRPLSSAQVGVLCAALTLGIVHNLVFHPVVILAAALSVAMARESDVVVRPETVAQRSPPA